MPITKQIFIAFLSCFICGTVTPAYAEIRVLFLGNSYTGANNLQAVVENIAASASPSVEIVADVRWSGGVTLWYYANTPEFHNLITNGNYDFVVLQDQSQRPANVCEWTLEDATILDGIITASGAKTVMFMTWGRQSGDPTIEPLAECYTLVADTLNSELAPVGLAWDRALTLDPALTLHTADGSHPNERGTYLAACIFYSLFTSSTPIGLGKGGLTNVSNSDAAFLQQVAWDLLKEDFGYEELPATSLLGNIILGMLMLIVTFMYFRKVTESHR
jgi:hypothetical protein